MMSFVVHRKGEKIIKKKPRGKKKTTNLRRLVPPSNRLVAHDHTVIIRLKNGDGLLRKLK